MAIIKRTIDRIRGFRDWRDLPVPVQEQYRGDRARRLHSDPGIDKAVAESVAWLCRAQANSSTADGGVARHYSIVSGWGASYPETTGYIIPTVINYAKQTSNSAQMKCAQDMLDWLLKIQLPDGSFQGGTIEDRPIAPTVFNTGQILMGLSAGSVQFGDPYTSAMQRAATWLVDCQDDDGCWRKNQSPFALAGDKTYDTHTAWGLLEAARVSGNETFVEAALKNIRWAMGNQSNNGWFKQCCLTDPENPLTHTLAYALRGIIEGYRYCGAPDLLKSARLTADSLLQAVGPGGYIPGRFDKNWNGVTTWSCLTGDVQFAICWLMLFQDTAYQPYLDAAREVNRYVRRTIDISGDDNTRGAIRGSFPIYGLYGQNQYLNWAAKFFIDSNLLERSIVEHTP